MKFILDEWFVVYEGCRLNLYDKDMDLIYECIAKQGMTQEECIKSVRELLEVIEMLEGLDDEDCTC